jgi:hypothetical protein
MTNGMDQSIRSEDAMNAEIRRVAAFNPSDKAA